MTLGLNLKLILPKYSKLSKFRMFFVLLLFNNSHMLRLIFKKIVNIKSIPRFHIFQVRKTVMLQ